MDDNTILHVHAKFGDTWKKQYSIRAAKFVSIALPGEIDSDLPMELKVSMAAQAETHRNGHQVTARRAV